MGFGATGGTINVDNDTLEQTGAGLIQAAEKIRVPIGGIINWCKSFTGVPTIPDGFLECDGSVINDADSPLNGETLPDLNGDNRFLRGNSTSGGTGGSATHSLITAEMPAHTHTYPRGTGAGADAVEHRVSTSTTGTTSSAGSGDPHNNEPQYYDVVYIMRVR